jgi:hypothetical protein
MILTGEQCSNGASVTLFITDSTWNGLGSNPTLRGERPATDHLSHGTVCASYCCSHMAQSVHHVAVHIL